MSILLIHEVLGEISPFEEQQASPKVLGLPPSVTRGEEDENGKSPG
jgi:hypothetical protein